jgi:capsular exopolysaccharide synthesis family protein
MSKITEALKKSAEEMELQKKEIVFSDKPPSDEPPKLYRPQGRGLASSSQSHKLPLEERLRNRIYIAKATDDSGIDPRIVTYFDPKSAISEQYRIIRTHIQLNHLPKPLKTIMISSALHGEGKTITAVNLAIIMAHDLEKTVLLVDCDLRGGTIHQLLSVNPTGGLSDILINDIPLEAAFYKTRINNLTILPRGGIPHNPSELLGSKRMRKLLEELKSKFDYIVLDSPAIIPLTDASVLGSMVDGVISIVQAYRTPRRMVEHAQNLFKHVHAKIVGFILTQAEDYLPKYMYRYLHRDKLDNLADKSDNLAELTQ